MHPLLIGGASLIGIAIAFVLVFRRLLSTRVKPVEAEWLLRFSPSRYHPIERLLREADYRFLISQPGYRRSIGRRLRAERRWILRGYLRVMRRDFNRLYDAAKLLVLYAPEDRSEFAWVLLRRKIAFESSMLTVRLSLRLHWPGLTPADLGGLVRSLESLRAQIPVPAAG